MKFPRNLVKKKIGEILVEMAHINQQQLEQALLRQESSRVMLGNILIELGYITEKQLQEALAIQNQEELVNNSNP